MSLASCPVCLSSRHKKYFRLRSNGLLAARCEDCSHVFIKNSPITNENVSDYYTMSDYEGERQLQDGEWYTDYYKECFADYESYRQSSLVLKQFEEKLGYLETMFPERGRLLDVGCATGVFLDMARKRGWRVQGIEVSIDLASYAAERFSLPVRVLDLTQDEFDAEPFDVITLFDVVEHLTDPNAMIDACRKLLRKNGLLLLRTPTEEGLLRDIAKIVYRMTMKKWDFPMQWFYSFEHIQSFSSQTLNRLVENHDLYTVKIFREDESLDRLNIPGYVKYVVKGIGALGCIFGKQHKISLIAENVGG